jgi:N-methylhydantoinase A/oxoprolinase/acetone carboxylase beta subunit
LRPRVDVGGSFTDAVLVGPLDGLRATEQPGSGKADAAAGPESVRGRYERRFPAPKRP